MSKRNDKPKKVKQIGLAGIILSTHSQSISNVDIMNCNKATLASLNTSSSVLEATRTWEVSVLLFLFDDDIRATTKDLLLKKISGIK